MAALLLSLEFGETVWGVGLLEEPPPVETEQSASFAEKQSVALRTPVTRDPAEIARLPGDDGELRGEMLLKADWNETGASLQLHSVRSLNISVSRLYELRGTHGASDDESLKDEWLLQIWGAPSRLRLLEAIPFCRMGVRSRGPLFTDSVLYLERTVELQWPESWGAPGPSKALPDAEPQRDVAARLRRAMFEGAAPDDATARSLKHWADLDCWFLFGPLYARYDDELLPIDEPTALHPGGDLALSPEALKELREDRDYIACHASVVRFILLSWGWDVATGELVDANVPSGQGWRASGQHAWRLRHLCLSCWLLGQSELRQSCNDFVLTLGSQAPWDEDGRSEADFTLGRYRDSAAVEAFWNARRAPSCPTRDERTLLGILLAADHVLDVGTSEA